MFKSIDDLIDLVKKLPWEGYADTVRDDLLAVLQRAKSLQVSWTLLLKIAQILITEPITKSIPDITVLLEGVEKSKA